MRSTLGGLGIQTFNTLAPFASQLVSNAFGRTLSGQQFLINQFERDRQRKLQESAQKEAQEQQEDKFLENTLLTAGIGTLGGAAAGGLAANAAGSSIASGIGQGALVGGLSAVPGGGGAAGIIANSSPLLNPQIGLNNQRLALDTARLANDTLATRSLIQSREDNAGYQRDKLKQDAEQFETTNTRLAESDAADSEIRRLYEDGRNARFYFGEVGKDNRLLATQDRLDAREGIKQRNRIDLEGVRQENRFDLADINNRADTTRTLLRQDRIDKRFQQGQDNSLNRPAIRGQQAGVALAETLSSPAYKTRNGSLNQAGIDLAMSTLLEGDFGPELPNLLSALGQKGFPVDEFLDQQKRPKSDIEILLGGRLNQPPPKGHGLQHSASSVINRAMNASSDAEAADIIRNSSLSEEEKRRLLSL